jgi:hypothetical protein
MRRARRRVAAGLLAGLIAGVALLLQATPAPADPLADLARAAPVHAILEIMDGAPEPRGVAERCRLQATIRRVFRAAPALPVGQRISIAVGCYRTPVPDEGGGIAPANLGYVHVDYLAAGALVEAYLLPAIGSDGLLAGGFAIPRLLAVPSLSDAPRDVLPPPGQPPLVTDAPGRPRPPNFPERDVTMTFRLSARPGETFRASYAVGPRHAPLVRVESLGPTGAQAGATLYQPGTEGALRFWDATGRTAQLSTSREDRAGRLTTNPHAFFSAEGSDQVAGLACTVWRIEDLLRRLPVELACVTADGLVLRREDAAGRMEALQVTYGPSDPALFRPMLPAWLR